MTENAPLTALVVCLWGQDLAAAKTALDQWRTGYPGRRLFALCLAGTELPEDMPFDRVVRLPLGQEHLAHVEAIGLQLCLNEGMQFVGSLRTLATRDIEEAARHLDRLASGEADVIVIADPEPHRARLFVSDRAAFLASSWLALGGELAPARQRIASALLDLVNRKGLVFRGTVAGYGALERSDPAQLASYAEEIRRRLGLIVGGQRPLRTRPVRRVAVITPYYKEPDGELRRMLESVAAQTGACHHFMVSDGFPNPLARDPRVTHIELGKAHGDNGNTPRYVGAMVALALGYDAVALLDADNWLEPHHVERLVARQHETGAGAVFALRNNFLPDGTRVRKDDEMESRKMHVDTSCMMLTRGCEFAIHLWGQMPMEWGPVCDRVVFVELTGHNLAWTKNRTLNFKSHYAGTYIAAGRPVPRDVHFIPDELFRGFETMPESFRQRAISRTGRVIKLIGA